MRMKGMDGIETLRKLKERDASLPVIISSAYEEYKNDFGSWASDAYIVKSADTAALRDTVKKILGKARSEHGHRMLPCGSERLVSCKSNSAQNVRIFFSQRRQARKELPYLLFK